MTNFLSRVQIELLSAFSTECEMFEHSRHALAESPSDFKRRIVSTRTHHMLVARAACIDAGIDYRQLEIIEAEAETDVAAQLS